MPKDNESTKWLYEQLKSKGYNVGKDQAEFDNLMRNNKASREWAYKTATSAGLNVGKDQSEFDNLVAPRQQAPEPTQEPANDTQESTEETAWKPTMQEKLAMNARLNAIGRSAQRTMDDFNTHIDNLNEYGKTLGDGHTVNSGYRFNPDSKRMERTYLTPTGERTFNKAAADAASREYRDAVDMTVGGQIRRAQNRLQELKDKAAARQQELHDKWEQDYKNNKAPLAAVLARDTYVPSIQSDHTFRALQAAIHQTEEQIKTLNEQKDRENGVDVGFWRGFMRTAGDLRSWDFGINDMLDAMTMLHAQDKDRPQTEQEKDANQDMMRAIHEYQQTEAMYGGNASFWNRAGMMTGYMPSFMLDFALTGGGYEGINVASRVAGKAATKALGKEAVKNMAEQGFKTYIKNNGLKGLGQEAANWTIKALGTTTDELLIRAPLMTNTVQAGDTAADIINRKLGDVTVDENGNYDFTNDKTWGSAIWQGEANSIVENYSEMFGTHLPEVASLKNLGKLANVIGAKRLSGVLSRANAGALGGITDTTRRIFGQMGVSDYLGEVSEEYYGQLWRTMLNLDDAYQQNADGTRTNLFATKQFHGDIWGGMALSMGLMGAGKTTMSAAGYLSMKHDVNKADTMASELLTPDVWEPLRSIIDMATNDNVGDVAERIVSDKELTNEEKAAVLNYMERSLYLRGANLAELVKSRGGEQDENIQRANDSYIDGYNAATDEEKQNAKNMYDLQRQKAEQILSPETLAEIDNDPMGALRQLGDDEEANHAIIDYINAKQVYDGMIQRVRDDIDSRIEQSNTMIDSRVNRATGAIQGVTMKVQDDEGKDRRAYVLEGNLVMLDDGTGIDHDNSDESIVIRDAATGAIEMVSPDAILSMEQPVDPELEKQTAAEAIRQQFAGEAANRIDGVLPFNQGDTYTLTDENGQQSQIQIVPNQDGIVDNGDGTVNVSSDGGVTVVPMSKDDIQLMSDATNRARVLRSEQQREAERLEQAQPEYSLNTEVTLRDEAGNAVRGSITADMNEDGQYEVYTESPINGRKVNLFTADELNALNYEQPDGNNGGQNIPQGNVAGYSVNEEAVNGITLDDFMKTDSSYVESYYTEHPESMATEIQEKAETTADYLNGNLSAHDYLAALGYATGEKSWLDNTTEEEIEQTVSDRVAAYMPFLNQPAATEAVQPDTTEVVSQPQEQLQQPQQSALERIPKDDKGEPVYEQADADTAWDAIVEQAEGDEATAKAVADSMVADKEAELKKVEKAKPKGGTTVAEKIAAERERKNAVEQAKATLAHWQKIAQTAERRRQVAMAEQARAAAVDARLVQADAEDDPKSKTNEAVRQTLRSLKETADYKGTVAIFADNYQNKQSGFNLYEDIRNKLIAAGVPSEQIVVMKSGMTVKKKLEIFDKVNRGDVRVILGSTFTLGTGVNIQERLHTLIHLDAPNRPMDYTQRNGRILRQGNLHKAMGKPVRILRFGVEDSLDVTAYQRLKTKGAIADSIMNGKQLIADSMSNRVLEEDEDVFGDVVAQLSGSEYALLKNNAEKNVRKYESRKKQWEADQTYIHNAKPKLKALIEQAETRAKEQQKYLDAVKKSFPNGTFESITIGKQTFKSVDAMADFIKGYNKTILDASKKMKEGGNTAEETHNLSVSLGDYTFKVKTVLSRETARGGGQLFSEIHRNMTYSCPELGLTDVPVHQSLLRNAIDDIVTNVITGKDFAERVEAAERSAEHNRSELEQLQSRENKPFEYEDELKQAHEKLKEYSELMKKEMAEKEAKYAEMDASVDVAENITNIDDDDVLYRIDNFTTNEEEANDLFRVVDDESEIERLNSEPTIKVYRAMSLVDGKLYPPMSKKIGTGNNRISQAPSEFGQWEVSDERPQLVEKEGTHKNHIYIVKDNGKGLWVAYNPYFHTSRNPLNDQFAEAYQRPNLVTVEVEVPESELTSGYQADGAKDPVGETKWNAGPVNRQLSGDKKRKVILSRWMRPVRIVPDSEVAERIAELIEGENVAIPDNTVTPSLLSELKKLGVKIVDGINKGRKKSPVVQRSGEGTLTDDELSLANDPVEKLTGKSTRTSRQRREFAERERERMAGRVQELAEKLHLDNVDIVTDASTLNGRRARAKGFYSRSTGRITIVIPNHSSMFDVEQTLLHEAVAHYGLRQLFGEHFDTFLRNVYENADVEVRQRITELASRNGWDYPTATEEYLASLAENTNFENIGASWWNKIKELFLKMLHKIGFENFSGVTLSDNELRYILWRSYENLAEPGRYRSILGEAEDVAMQNSLKVGNYAVADTGNANKAADDAMFRDGDPEVHERAFARRRYEERVKRGMFQTQEALQDSMLGLREAMDAILKGEGKKKVYIEDVDGFENAYLGENRLSSVNKAEADAFAHILFKPLLDEVARLAPGDDARQQLTDYMMAKHGLERNSVMRQREKDKLISSSEIGKQKPQPPSIDDDDYDLKMDAYTKAVEDWENQVELELGDKFDDIDKRDFAGLTALTGLEKVSEAEAEASQIVDDYENDHDTSELWKRVNDVSGAILSKLYETGMMSKKTYDDVSSMYEYYIPLRGFDEKTSKEAYAYLNSKDSAFTAPIKTAKGRKSKADDPFAYLQNMAESAIMQGNRNKLVKQKFLNFVLNHPSDLASVSDLWLEYDKTLKEWKPVFPNNIEGDDTPEEVERKMQDFEDKMKELAEQEPDRYKHGKDAINIPYRVVESRDLHQHQVVVKRNGRDYVITINGNPRAAQALNGQTNPDNDMSGAIGAILKAGERINRELSALYTTRNPDFVVSNFIRDMLYANSMVWIKESPNYALRYHRNFAKVNPVRMKILLAKYRKNTLDMNNDTERMFKQFMMNGGETGYANIRDIDKRKNDIRRELRKANGRLPIRKAWDLLSERFDEWNRAVENCARFAVFMTSREMGRTIDRAVYDAKDISVNFNKKGSGAKFMGATGQTALGNASAFISGLGRSGFVFWNAAIQGTTNFGRQIKRHPAKALSGLAAMFLLGAVIASLGYGDDDDDDKNSYWNLPEYVRRSNILFRIGDQWISIPLPVEYRAVYGLGELMISTMSGKEHLSDGELANAIAGQVSQILPLDILEGGGGMKAFIPSSIKPFAEAYGYNKSWTGLPIYKDTPYNKDMPEWTKAYKSANKYLVDLSEVLNEATGGDKYTKGKIDINPAKVEYVLTGYFGGVANTIDRLTKMGETFIGQREYDPKSFLILNRVIKNGDERTEYKAVNNEYFRLKEEHDKFKTRLRHYESDTNNGIFDYAEKIDFLYNSPEYERYEIFENYRPSIDEMYDILKEITDDDERKSVEADLNELKKMMISDMNETRNRK